jgi:hypothetical protein
MLKLAFLISLAAIVKVCDYDYFSTSAFLALFVWHLALAALPFNTSQITHTDIEFRLSACDRRRPLLILDPFFELEGNKMTAISATLLLTTRRSTSMLARISPSLPALKPHVPGPRTAISSADILVSLLARQSLAILLAPSLQRRKAKPVPQTHWMPGKRPVKME